MTHQGTIEFEKIQAGIYRARVGNAEMQARKIADGVWVSEIRPFDVGGRFDFDMAAETLRDAKARILDVLAGVATIESL